MKRNQLPIWFKNIRKFRFVNRKYKDRLFQRVFRDKKDLLSLYNAINGTAHTNEDDLEITTLEDVIFMSMKNDKSFIISSTMNLYEHQSTVNPNMPIRGFLYFAQLYDEYIKLHGLDIYGDTQIKLPMPQYIVFYNGQEDFPDTAELRLSDAFESDPDATPMEPSLECTARVINVNYGHNNDIMEKCTRLMQYAQLIARINSNLNSGMDVIHAIDEAITYCLEHDILVDILIKNRSEVQYMLLTEFDEKKFAKTMKREGYAEGLSDGISQGISQNQDITISILYEIQNGNNTVESLTALGYDAEYVKSILDAIK